MVELTDNKFNSEVLEAEGVVLVDFGHPGVVPVGWWTHRR